MEARRQTTVDGYRVAIGLWDPRGRVEEIGASIHRELAELGHRPEFFCIDRGTPPPCDVLLLHGPRGRFLPVLQQAHRQSPRPRVAVWNTQGLPDPRLPWPLMKVGGGLRRRFASIGASASPLGKSISETSWFATLDARLMRFDFVGQYVEAIARGWIDDFFDISEVYAGILSRQGMRVKAVPFGSMAGAYEELRIERDIDVLWIGTRGSRRRSRMLDRIRADLHKRGIELCVVDGDERPFVFGPERTRLFNRSKVTLNLLRTWYDENSMRLCLAAPNRSLIVSEPLLPHVPSWEPGKHYLVACPDRLADTIEDLLADEKERERITERAFRFATSARTFAASIKAIMRSVEEGIAGRSPG
jgi:hypothetical protein